MWELWQWDGRYIKGNKKGEFFFEDKEGRAVGMLIEKQDAKKTKK